MASSTGTEIKVGIFVFIAIVVLAYMSITVGTGSFFGGGTYDVSVYFDNVTGLKSDAPVEIAGINVGRVATIELDQGRAKLVLRIKEEATVRADVIASIRTRGVLGDKYIELNGGTDSYPLLTDGQNIQRSDRSADLDLMFEKVGQIADDIGLVAKSVANVMGGADGERDLRLTFHSLRDLSVGLNQMVQTNMESVNLIVKNLREFSGDMRQMSAQNKQSVNAIISNFEQASGQLSTTLGTMNTLLAKVESGEGTMGKLISDEKMGDDLQKTVASLESVARKIDEGQGTLGKLVNESNTAEELDKALEGINDYIAKQDQFKTSVDFSTEYLEDSSDFKTYLNLKLQPSASHYYMLGVVSDPSGRVRETDTVTRTSVGGGAFTETINKEKKTEFDRIKFNAQIAKRWDDVVLRGGLFESTGGVGLDYYMWDDRAMAFFEAFELGSSSDVHLKTGLKLYFLKNFYVSAGFDNFASAGNESFFGGLGLTFTDDDLKYVMGSVPTPAP